MDLSVVQFSTLPSLPSITIPRWMLSMKSRSWSRLREMQRSSLRARSLLHSERRVRDSLSWGQF